tara:strand:- start:121 stop:363 length:243 start_codon:yes stop_codon:yes gene_type:complete
MSDGGSVVSFELDGDKPRAFRFLNALQLVDISNNLGDSKSLIPIPRPRPIRNCPRPTAIAWASPTASFVSMSASKTSLAA